MSLRNWLATGRQRRAGTAILIAFWAVSICAQTAPAGQKRAASNPGATLYPIAGKLTDSISGQPVPGATMELSTSRPRQSIQTTETGNDGEFAFDPVPQGKYSVTASRRGYRSEDFDEHEIYSSAIVTGPEQDTEHIPFHIAPGGEIQGFVTDDAGEPVIDAKIQLTAQLSWGGLGEHLVTLGSFDTDDRGEFKIWSLRPGKYFIAVKATPWFALHPAQSERDAAMSDEQRTAQAALDVVYPVAYFDGTTDEKAATPVIVTAGATVETDISLRAVPAIHLMLRMAQTSSERGSFPILRQHVLGSEMPYESFVSRTGTDDSATYEFAITPGSYDVTGGHPPRITEIDATGNQDVDLDQGMQVATGNVRGQMADGSPLPKPLNVVLQSVESSQRRIVQRIDDQGFAHFNSVPPGRWIAIPTSRTTPLAVVATQRNGQTTPGSVIDLAGQPTQLTLVMEKGETRIEGFATASGKGEPGVMVVLVPHDPAANLAEFRRDQSDSDGSFVLLDVIPGAYTMVAIRDGWDVDWAEPDVIGRYLPGGTAMTVPQKAGQLIKLHNPIEIQPR